MGGVLAGWVGLAAALLHPIGFLIVVLGRSQLYTKNTVAPVAVVLTNFDPLPDMLWLWVVIFAANVLGAMLFAFTVIYGEVVPPPALQVLFGEAAGKLDHGFWNTILNAGVGGWLVRLWPGWPPPEIRSSRRLLSMCWSTLYRPVVQFYCVAGSSEVRIGVFAGEVSSLET
jgi:formate-nitrite transporter family protein